MAVFRKEREKKIKIKNPGFGLLPTFTSICIMLRQNILFITFVVILLKNKQTNKHYQNHSLLGGGNNDGGKIKDGNKNNDNSKNYGNDNADNKKGISIISIMTVMVKHIIEPRTVIKSLIKSINKNNNKNAKPSTMSLAITLSERKTGSMSLAES